MRRIKITAFITFTAVSAFLLVLSFTPPAGGETPSASGAPIVVQPYIFPDSVRAEALEILASDSFDEMSSAGQMNIERMAGARKIDGVITPFDFSSPSVSVSFAGAEPEPDPSSFVDPLVNNPAADATSQNTQSETAIVLGSGTNVVSSFNDSGSNAGGANKFTGYSTSANSGTAWIDRGALPTAAGNGDAGDPVLARNNTTGTVLLSTLNFDNNDKLNIYRSLDNGVTFGPPIDGSPGLTGAAGNQDKEWLAVDNFAGAGDGNAYLFWRNFGAPGGMTLTRSTDDGLTWALPAAGVIAAGGQGAQVAVGPDHSVYLEWFATKQIVIRRSTDQGVTFAAATTVTPILSTGVNGDLGLGGFRSSTFPQLLVNPVSGNLYTVYPDNPAGADRADVFFRQSIDNGATWSAAVRVNTDAGTNDNWQPSLAVTPDGTGLFVGFYDRRGSATNNRIEYWGRTATIAGSVVTFSCDFPISSADFPVVVGVDPAINSTYMGDYDMATASNANYYVQWGENHSGNSDVRFALVPTAGACEGPTPPSTPAPNPAGTAAPTPACAPLTEGVEPACAPLTEGFDDILTLPGAGWAQINNSAPGGTTGWFQGNDLVFPSQSGASDSYIAANFQNTSGANTISNWLLTPPLTLQNGATMTFWTRTFPAPEFADRLQVRMSTNGGSTDVGTTPTSVGDFTFLLLDINPTYTLTGYPDVWTQFTVTVTGVGSSTTGRLAFRYFVENGGPKGANSDYIGIDTFQYSCLSPTPTPIPPPGPRATPTPSATATPMPTCGPLSEGFNNILTLPGAGWAQINNSPPGGTTGWFQGNDLVFPSQSGASDSYIAANFQNTSGANTISNWLLTPPLTLQDGATLTFYTRTIDVPKFADRLQVRMSTNGGSRNVGTTATDVGDFSFLLLDINPTYTLTGYPNAWTQFTVTVTGVAAPTIGRLAFRYFVENGGPNGANSDYIGIDTLQFNAICGPTPTATPGGTATPTPTCAPLSEGFNNILTLPGAGWAQINNSAPGGTTGWFQGNELVFPSQSGAPNSYIAANFQNTSGANTISNWLLTPPLTLQDGATLTFWTRTFPVPEFADRLQVRMSTNGTSTNVGTTTTSVGDFTALLLDINPTYTLTGYPNVWTQFTVTLSGIGSPTTGRLAFRYFVENGGPNGANSDYIGIDTVQYSCIPPTPTPTPTPGPSVNISGTVRYCSNPVPGPVPNVTLTLTGTASGSTMSDGSGNYTFSSLASGGNYTVTPTKAARAPGSANINTVDVIAVQRHFLVLGTPLSGCRLTAADVDLNSLVNTVDVIAIQRFFLGLTTGIAQTGKYKFTPVSRSYMPLVSNQTAQDYDTLVYGDAASAFVELLEGESPTAAD